MNSEQIGKLPKWAQAYIHQLERRVNELTVQNQAILGPEKEGFPVVGDLSEALKGRCLPTRRVYFPIAGIGVRYASPPESGIEIYTNDGQAITIQPLVTNVVQIFRARGE